MKQNNITPIRIQNVQKYAMGMNLTQRKKDQILKHQK